MLIHRINPKFGNKVLVNQVPYEEHATDSVINLYWRFKEYPIQENHSKKFRKLMVQNLDLKIQLNDKFPKFYKEQVGDSSLLKFKRLFGKQLECVNYTNRNWVWTFSLPKKPYIQVNALVSKEGISWEYDLAAQTKEDATAVLDLHIFLCKQLNLFLSTALKSLPVSKVFSQTKRKGKV